jgi:hypothetical protein
MEHLDRAEHIQRVAPVDRKHEHMACSRHAFILSASRPGR